MLDLVAPDPPTQAGNTVSSCMHEEECTVTDISTSRAEEVTCSTWRVTAPEEIRFILCVFTCSKYQMSGCWHERYGCCEVKSQVAVNLILSELL